VTKLSLNVVPPPREPQVGSAKPSSVVIAEPMRRFKCNQKGCCCSGWDIPFRLEDFLRLHDHLGESERAQLTSGLKLILQSEPDKQTGQQILHSLKLDGVGDDRACRFLESGGGCSVHAKHGVSALPDLCVDFPAFGYKLDDGRVELWFDPVCPEVLEQLDESDGPLRLHRQAGFFGDEGLDLRVAHTSDRGGARIGKFAIEVAPLDRIRSLSIEAFGSAFGEPAAEASGGARPVWRTLMAVSHAFRRLRIGNEASFEIVEPEDPQPFFRFLLACVGAHGAAMLSATLTKYRRFIWAIDSAQLAGREEVLAQHLEMWQPAYQRWLAPQEELLRPLTARYLAYRFGTPMVKGRGELREAADSIVQVYATSLRYAAALGAALERPVDRDLYKVAIGAAEFFYRSLNLPREALPWFAAAR
jgi:Fe-S-cluster containining protein